MLAPPTLAWAACTEVSLQDLECATLIAPKDYSNPARGNFSLAVVRQKATGSASERIGTLFFNPGGPGESGVSLAPPFAAALPADLRKYFDFVTWDPRGVVRSAGLAGCSSGTYTLPPVGPVDWNATVRDLDRLREAVGDQELTYWGTSYGTRIGYVYAHDYPDRVRAMLLSSPISPNATWPSFALGAATAPSHRSSVSVPARRSSFAKASMCKRIRFR
jgi:pimeloyl-ACP methyl ester carboxylesterase